MRVEAPEGDCPKCGEVNAFREQMRLDMVVVGGRPHYVERTWTVERPTKVYNDTNYEEVLAWPCRRCGYETETPVLG